MKRIALVTCSVLAHLAMHGTALAEYPSCGHPELARGQVLKVSGVLGESGRDAAIVMSNKCAVRLVPDGEDSEENPNAAPLDEWRCQGGEAVTLRGRYYYVSNTEQWLEPIDFSCN